MRYRFILYCIKFVIEILYSVSCASSENNTFKDVWNMDRLVHFRSGNFSYFYDVPIALKTDISKIYKFLNLLNDNKYGRVFDYCLLEPDELMRLVCIWRHFMHCLTTTNTITDRIPCNPFYMEVCYIYIPIKPTTIAPETTTIEYGFNNTTTIAPFITTAEYFNFTSEIHRAIILNKADFDWQPSRLKYLDPEVSLMIFNLFMCTQSQYKYLCPDICLSNQEICASISNLHSINCFSTTNWKEEINKLKDIQHNQFDIRSLLYSCDCNYGYTWSFHAKACSFGGFYPNPCNLFTQAPCKEEGTAACIGDSYNGEFICRCKPQYVGALCENMIDPCQMDVVTVDGDTEDEVEISSDKSKSSKSYTSGYQMCQVNMSGIAIKGKPNECIPELGTRKYLCVCQYPFLEDLIYKVSNCMKRETSCYNQLCIHGECKETDDGEDSLCVCQDDYEGPMCNQRMTVWSHWTECRPECGKSRMRHRGRVSYYGLNYTQMEKCPSRVSDDCPDVASSSRLLSMPFTNDELKFYSFYFMTTIISVLGLSLIMYLSRLIMTPKFVVARKRIREKNKLKQSLQKQQFSIWKVEQEQQSDQLSLAKEPMS